MAKVSEIISKMVVSLYNGQIEGVVENALFSLDTGKLKYLVVYNEQNECTYALSANNIYSVGNGAVSIKNNTLLNLVEGMEMEMSELYNPINTTAFKVNGDKLGIVTDIEIDEKHNIANLIVNTTQIYNKKLVANFTKNTIIIKEENSKINLKNFAAKTKFSKIENDTRIVNILQIKSNQLAQEPTSQIKTTHPAATKIKSTQFPNRAIANYTFLINRKVRKNITGQNGSLIIKQNTKINTNTINVARQNGKLKELTEYSF